MSGEEDLDQLIKGMTPILDPVRYVFAVADAGDLTQNVEVLMRFTEAEGETLILSEEAATHVRGLTCSPSYARITLGIHSSLEAVGFLAKVCSALADAGISTNAVAAFHHDHVFVPAAKAEEAMEILQALSASAG